MVPYKLFGNIDFLLYKIITDWTIAIGTSLVILLVLKSMRISKTLNFPAVRFFGYISYSLYLIHPVILISIVHIFYDVFSFPFILCIAFVLTLLFSWLSYKFIEKPSINIGRAITKSKKEAIKNNELSI